MLEPVVVKADFTVDGFGQSAGDFLYVSPMLLGRVEENPLKAPERTFPVDMGYGRDIAYTATINIPENYTVSEMPQNLQFGMQGGGVLYKRIMAEKDGKIEIMCRLTVAKVVFPPNQYAALRGFYERVVSASGEQIVLQRKAATSGSE